MDEAEEVFLAASKIRQPSVPAVTKVDDGEQSPTSEYPTSHRKKRRVKRKKRPEDYIEAANFDIPGVSKIVISPAGQKAIECTVGEHVTSENPWKYISKEALEDNIELKEGSSEFLPIKNEVLTFPRPELLMGYIPDEQREYDEFYICLTEGAEDAVSEIIKRLQNAQKERLYNSINKTIKPWRSLGSEIEVNRMLHVTNRPLLEVEVETNYPIMKNKCKFRLRLAEQARDGYVEILSTRKVFTNIERKQITSAVQVTPTVTTHEAQTTYTYPKNAWTQYEYDYEPVETVSEEFKENLQEFADTQMDKLSDMITVNSHLNLYSDDYSDLVKDPRYARVPLISLIKEYSSFIEENVCKGKEIASVSWHPMWTGTVAVAYSDEAPSNYRNTKPKVDEIREALYDVVPVLLWSFKDSLNPRLYLETPRAVHVVSFCPYDENILIGGCCNGQIIVWDIKDKLQNVEKDEMLTPEQQKNREHLFNYMRWMKNTKDLKLVRITAVSELQYSHKSSVTAIRWFSPYREMSKSGQIREIAEEENRKSLQFVSSSKDGSILTWDLLAKPTMYASVYRPQRKLRRLKERPPALITEVSPFKDLNRLLKPVFKINIYEPRTNRPLPLAQLTIRKTAPKYEEVNPDPTRKFNIADRIVYRPLFNKATHPLFNKLIVGTCEGDFLIAAWEGFEFNAGEVVNKETAKIESFAKYHDGPIVSISRSELFPNLVLTVGGKVFCLWIVELIGRPVMWRRSKHRYTQGVWNSHRPSMFRLTRNDGYMEMWHLKTRSDRYQTVTQVSGIGVTGTFTHTISMKQNILGVGDATGALRLFYIAHNLTEITEEDQWSTYRFCEREVARKERFTKWQTEWLTTNAEWVKEKREQDRLNQQEKEENAKREKERLALEKEQAEKEEAERLATLSKPQPGEYSEWAQRQWMEKEKDRMKKVLMAQKSLDIDQLEKQQLPLAIAQKEEDKKRVKQKRRLDQAEDLFDETINMMFPDAVIEKPIPPPDPYAGGEPLDVKLNHLQTYSKLEKECEEFIRTHTYVHHFNWFDVIKSGKERRRVLDGHYTRNNHANRLLRERIQKQELLSESNVIKKPPEVQPKEDIIPESISEEVLMVTEESLEE